MNDGKHILIAICGSLSVLILGGALLVWPSLKETQATRQEITLLQKKIMGLAEQTKTVEALADELNLANLRVESELKVIPQAADIAGLMRKLSLPVDGSTVLDQTFTAGNPNDAVIGEEFIERAMPLTVDMEATFESVFALIRSVETMDRLVRVSSVRMAVDRTGNEPDVPVLDASVGLEVIYKPLTFAEGY